MNIRLFIAKSVLQASWTVNHLDSNSQSWYSTNNIKFNFCTEYNMNNNTGILHELHVPSSHAGGQHAFLYGLSAVSMY